MTTWTPERIEQARILYVEQGLAASKVAEIMGLSSRSMVIGIKNRMQHKDPRWIRSPEIGIANSKAASPTRAPRSNVQHPSKSNTPRPKKRTPILRIVGDETETGAVTFMDRKTHQCCFPIGPTNEPGSSTMMVCGDLVGFRKDLTPDVYCQAHRKICSTPALSKPGKPYESTVVQLRATAR